MKRLVYFLLIIAVALCVVEHFTRPLLVGRRSGIKPITIVYGPELRSLMDPLSRAFERIAPSTNSGTIFPVIRNLLLHPLIVAKGMDTDDKNFDAWIIPHEEFALTRARTVPQNSINQCAPIFHSRIGIVSHRSLLKNQEQSLSHQRLKELLSSGINLSIADPVDSSSGWSPYKEIRCSEESMPGLFDSIRDNLVYTAPSEVSLLARLRDRQLEKNSILLTTESSAHTWLENHHDYIFTPLSDTRYAPSYYLCTKKNSPKDTNDMVSLFFSYLTTPHAADYIQQEGFRIPEKSPGRDFIPLSSIADTAHQNCGSFLGDLMNWPQAKKPTSTVFVIDSSASMDGLPLETILDALRQKIARATPIEQYAFVSFNSTVHELSQFSADPRKLVTALSGLHSGGGSAVYDGILQGLLLLEKTSSRDTLLNIVIITDGDDSNSNLSLYSLINRASEIYKSRPYSLSVIGVETSHAIHFDDLKELSHSLHGSFLQTPLSLLRNTMGGVH